MNKKLAATMVALLTLGMVGTATAQTLEDTNRVGPSDADNTSQESSNVNVTVSSETAIDVKPENLDFTGLGLGEQVTQETSEEDPRFGSLTLQNIGSEYIDRVWVEASSSMTTDPFGTGIASNYDAGNFLQIKPRNATPSGVKGDDSVYHYVNRYEFSNSWSNSTNEIPSYIRASPSESLDTDTAQDTYVGRLRAGDEWYFYSVVTGSSNDQCDGGGNAVVRIGNSVHDSSDDGFGTVDFTFGGNDYTTKQIKQTSGEYGVTGSSVSLDYEVNGDSVTREYDLLTRCDMGATGEDPHVIRTRYNVQAGDVEDLTAQASGNTNDGIGSRSQFLVDSGTPSNMLLPGEQLVVDTAIEVPQGVPQGEVTEGSLTFYITSDADAQTS